VIEKIFSFNKSAINQNVSGTRWLTKYPEFQNVKKLEKALQLLEDTNIWKHISFNQQKTGKTLITFGKEFGANDLVIASTSFTNNETTKQLSIVGPTRMNYSEVKGLLEFIKNEVENMGRK
jgi:heat-inducible transcriptional repressor